MIELRPRHRHLMEYLTEYVARQGFGPTFRDIKADTDYGSTSAIHYALRCLESGGYIELVRNDKGAMLARAIRVIRPLHKEDRLVLEFVGEDARMVLQAYGSEADRVFLKIAREQIAMKPEHFINRYTDEGYGVGNLPGRKQTALYKTGRGWIDPVAYFRNERDADEFWTWLKIMLEGGAHSDFAAAKEVSDAGTG